MTTEIAIMNTTAIALAADSASTITGWEQDKIFNSSNKLFGLSRYHPVGIMIYGGAVLDGVPWETIIKYYRDKVLSKNKFKTLKEYKVDFIKFIDNAHDMFPLSIQEQYYFQKLHYYFTNVIVPEIKKKSIEIIKESCALEESQVKKIVTEVIQLHHDSWEKKNHNPSVPKKIRKTIESKYKDEIKKIIKNSFQDLPLARTSSTQLIKIATNIITKFEHSAKNRNISGIVFAGFGEDEIFPSLEIIEADIVVENRLKYIDVGSENVNHFMRAAIFPFAQDDMVCRFMDGIDPVLDRIMQDLFSSTFNSLPDTIVDNLNKGDKITKDTLDKIKKAMESGKKQVIDLIKHVKETLYSAPIVEVVSVLPKDELASMAESLVHLTSLQRKVSPGTESVGGPVDVAVISKGDGFIWVKRKHYFEAKLNPHFFKK